MPLHPRHRSVASLLAVFPSRSAAAGLLAPCLPDIAASLGTAYEGVGSLVAAVYVGYALAVLAVGIAGHRARPRALLLGGAALQVLAVASFAVSPSLEWSRIAALAYGMAGVSDLAATAILAGMGGTRRGRLLTLAHGSYSLGAVIVPLAAGTVLEAGGTWRLLFAGAAGINLMVLGWVLLSGAGREASANGSAPLPGSGAGLWRVGEFRLGVLAMALYIAGEVGPAIWLPTWFRDRFGASVPVAAASVAVLWASMTVGRVVLAHRVDRPDARRLVARLAVVSAAAWLAVLLSSNVAVAFVAVALFGLSMSVCAPALQGFSAHPFPGLETPVMGWLATMSGLVGAILPWTIGAAAERIQGGTPVGAGAGLTWALAAGPVFLVAMAVVVVRSGAVRSGEAAGSL